MTNDDPRSRPDDLGEAASPGRPGTCDAADASGPRVVVRPWRTAIYCALIVVVLLLAARDLGLHDLVGEVGLLARTVGEPFRLVLAGGVVTAALYAILQIAGLALDGRLVHGHRSDFDRFGRIVRRMAGRRGLDDVDRHLDAVADWIGEASAQPLRLGLTAFPMIGFLGTVIGLSGAIEALPQAREDDVALGTVLGQLHVAFDTTLLGLLGALVCLVAVKAIEESVDSMRRGRP